VLIEFNEGSDEKFNANKLPRLQPDLVIERTA
jgi:hypothetical protein